MNNQRFFTAAFAIGLATVAWVGLGFVGGGSWVALAMTGAIAGAFVLGGWELRQFRAATAGLDSALASLAAPPQRLGDWLDTVPASLRPAVRQRVEDGRGALPGPALTPYLVGLLVMLGMLGTFLGMVVTFKGTVFALEGSADLQAVRAALAAPIKGLGLSFGTSVAGVAASALLGLMSALSRRERQEASRELDARIATALRAFSPAHQREQQLQALQAQAGVLPTVVERLEALVERIDQRGRQADEQLLERQSRFHREAGEAYGELTRSVAQSLERSLAAGAKAAGESLQPVVASAMAEVVQQARQLHDRLGESAQAQVDQLSLRFGATAQEVSATWQAALAQQERSAQAQAAGLQQGLADFAESFEQRGIALVASVDERLGQARSAQAQEEQQRLQAWTTQLQELAGALRAHWQQSGDQQGAQLQALATQLRAQWQQAGEQSALEQQQVRAELAATAQALRAQWQQAGEQTLAQQRQAQADLAVAIEALRAQWAQAGEQAITQRQQAHAELAAATEALRAQWEQAGEQAIAQRQQAQAELAGATEALRAQWEQAGEQALAQRQQVQADLAAATEVLRGQWQQSGEQAIEQQRLSQAELATAAQALRAQWQQAGEQALSQQQRAQEALAAAVQALQAQWQAAGEQAVTRQQAVFAALEQATAEAAARAAEQAERANADATRLREDMARLAEREVGALDERTELLERMAAVLQAVQHTAGEQRDAVQALVTSATGVMEQASSRFADTLQAQAGQVTELAHQSAASAVELASLAEAFTQGVQQFQGSSEQLAESLRRIEESLVRSGERSDEQLAYYVAQAREVVDLSIASQQGLVDSLRQLQARPARERGEPALADGDRG